MAENIPLFQVFTQKTLYEISKELPKNPQELLRINGMGKIRVKKYGEEILAVVDKYNAEEDKHQRKKKPKKKEKSSKEISLELFKDGISVEEIAKERDLVVGTIKGHLTSFILTGEVDVLELISKEKYKKIRKSIENTPFETISELKEKLNNSYTYPDLKMVLVSMEN